MKSRDFLSYYATQFLDAGDVAAKRTCSFFDVSLGEFLFLTHVAEAVKGLYVSDCRPPSAWLPNQIWEFVANGQVAEGSVDQLICSRQ